MIYNAMGLKVNMVLEVCLYPQGMLEVCLYDTMYVCIIDTYSLYPQDKIHLGQNKQN